MAVHPGIIPGWPSYLGIPRYLTRGGLYGYLSLVNPSMAKLLGNPGIRGQGRVYGSPSWDIPGLVVLCI